MVKTTGPKARTTTRVSRAQDVKTVDVETKTTPAKKPDGFETSQGPVDLPPSMKSGGASSIVAVRQKDAAPVARKALVLNSGSSSIKFQVIKEGSKAFISGKMERIGENESKLTLKVGDKTFELTQPVKDHKEALALIVEALTDDERGGLKLSDLTAVGHRVVHGGPKFKEPVRIDAEVEASIQEFAKLAPLHNPPALAGIAAAREVLGASVPQVAVFDTAFHTSLSEEASSYSLPKSWRDEGVRRYGFHGISVENATKRAAKMLGKPLEQTNLIVCHLGNGASITAVENGKSRDTSMGMTPLAGITMGTRPGDVDIGVVFFMAKHGLTLDQIEKDLNNKSGLLGLSDGLSNDVRELLAAEASGNERAKVALEKYTEDITEQIGAFLAKLRGNVDAIVFTGGVGENSGVIRERIVSHLGAFGYALDAAKNGAKIGDEADLSLAGAQRRILALRADEEGAIGEETFRLTRPKD
jgi:acetate kinase